MQKYLILEDIRSAHNVGAMFRTADGAGVTRIFLAGYTPAPRDRFGRPQPKITKTSLSASETVPWEQVSTALAAVERLQMQGVTVVAVEQTSRSVSLGTLSLAPDTSVAYVLGNEVTGVSAAVLERVDHIVDLPMLGSKESLNVATTAGIVLYHDLV